jgi:hypothetical protein
MALNGDRHDARGGARGGSPELSLALSPVITEALAIVSEIVRGLAARKQTRGESVRPGGPYGAPPALVPLLAVAASPLPEQPVERGRPQ